MPHLGRAISMKLCIKCVAGVHIMGTPCILSCFNSAMFQVICYPMLSYVNVCAESEGTSGDSV